MDQYVHGVIGDRFLDEMHERSSRHLRIEVVRPISGNQDDRECRVGRVEAVGERESVLTRHVVVGEEQVDVSECCKGWQMGGLGVVEDLVAIFPQHSAEACSKTVLILHE